MAMFPIAIVAAGHVDRQAYASRYRASASSSLRAPVAFSPRKYAASLKRGSRSTSCSSAATPPVGHVASLKASNGKSLNEPRVARSSSFAILKATPDAHVYASQTYADSSLSAAMGRSISTRCSRF